MRHAPFASLLLAATLVLAGCRGTHFEPPEIQGRAALVDADGAPRLWVVEKQEEQRSVTVGGGSRRVGDVRTDTFFHFSIEAFDPATARPLWKKKLLTIGDDEASGSGPSRVVGSSAEAKLLGQDGHVVWLMVAGAPVAVDARDGTVIADPPGIEQRNPDLAGLLSRDARHYGFDRGLVMTLADARQVVLRGDALAAEAYVPTVVPPAAPILKSDGSPRIASLEPPFGSRERHARIGDAWIGLYADAENADAIDDTFGDNYLFPYSITDTGAQSRRTLRRFEIVEGQNFDDRFPRLQSSTPIPDTPVFLNGRFLREPTTQEAFQPTDPPGLLVWHITRIDSDGRLALTRLDAAFRPLWTATLPLSDEGMTNPVQAWPLPGRVLVMGIEEVVDDDLHQRRPRLASIDLATGDVAAWDLEKQAALP